MAIREIGFFESRFHKLKVLAKLLSRSVPDGREIVKYPIFLIELRIFTVYIFLFYDKI